MARKKSLDRILADLQNLEPAVRRDALSRFHSLDWRSTRPSRGQRDQAFRAVASLLRGDSDQGVRFAAAHVLTFWIERRSTEALLAAAEREGETALVRGQAIEGLGSTLADAPPGKLLERVTPRLLAWLRDPAIEVRFWTVYTVGTLRILAARPILEELARTDDAMFENWWRVRDEAEDALASLAGNEWPERDPAWLRKGALATKESSQSA